MRSNELQILVDLALNDQRLLSLHHDVKKIQQDLVQKNHLYIQFQEHLHSMQHEYQHMKKDIDVQERYLKELQAKEDSLKIKMINLHAAKEYTACIKEVENIEQMISEQETVVLQMWEKFPEFEQKYQKDSAAVQHALDNLTPSIQGLKTQLQKLQEQIQEIELSRKDKLQDTQGEWITLYNTLHTKVANPMVAVTQESCGGCFYPISPLNIQLLQHRKLLQCQNCYRILFFKD